METKPGKVYDKCPSKCWEDNKGTMNCKKVAIDFGSSSCKLTIQRGTDTCVTSESLGDETKILNDMSTNEEIARILKNKIDTCCNNVEELYSGATAGMRHPGKNAEGKSFTAEAY